MSHPDPSPPCPECGAPRVGGMDCWEQLGALLAWEVTDRSLLAVHFLTVACYNLQHPSRFAEGVIDGLREALVAHLDQGLPVAQIRRDAGVAFEGKRRVLRPEAERHPVLRPWRVTVSDVYLPDQPEGAAVRVRRWAAAIRDEMEGNP